VHAVDTIHETPQVVSTAADRFALCAARIDSSLVVVGRTSAAHDWAPRHGSYATPGGRMRVCVWVRVGEQERKRECLVCVDMCECV